MRFSPMREPYPGGMAWHGATPGESAGRPSTDATLSPAGTATVSRAGGSGGGGSSGMSPMPSPWVPAAIAEVPEIFSGAGNIVGGAAAANAAAAAIIGSPAQGPEVCSCQRRQLVA